MGKDQNKNFDTASSARMIVSTPSPTSRHKKDSSFSQKSSSRNKKERLSTIGSAKGSSINHSRISGRNSRVFSADGVRGSAVKLNESNQKISQT